MDYDLPTLADPLALSNTNKIIPAGGSIVKQVGAQGILVENLAEWIANHQDYATEERVAILDCRAGGCENQLKGAFHVPMGAQVDQADGRVMVKALTNHRVNSPQTWTRIRGARLVIFYCEQGQVRSVGNVKWYRALSLDPGHEAEWGPTVAGQQVALVVGGISRLKDPPAGSMEPTRIQAQLGETKLEDTIKKIEGQIPPKEMAGMLQVKMLQNLKTAGDLDGPN